MVGLLTAVKLYLKRDHEARLSQDEEIVAGWCLELNRIKGVHAERSIPNVAGQPMPRAKVVIDAAAAGISRDEIVTALREGSPSIEVLPGVDDVIYVNPMTLQSGEDEIVLQRFLEILANRD
jgi:L-seryl-tRNA(Ser) seleniumtransferase